jgi:putative transcriptional regulator
MKKQKVKDKQPTAGRRILADPRAAVVWAEGGHATVHITTVDVPIVDVKATRLSLGLSQAAFAAKFGFQASTLRNWEQGRTQPDGPARVLLTVIAKHPEAVEDALRKAS